MHDCSLLSLSQEFPAHPLGQRPTSAQHPPGTGRGAPEGGATSLPWHRFRAKIIVHDSSSLCVPKCEGKRPFGRSGARQDEGVTALKPVLKQQVRMQTLASVWRNREWQYLFKTYLSGGMGGTKQNKKKLGLPEAGLEEVGETKLGFGICSSNSGEPLVSRAVGELGDLAARPVWPCTGGEILTTSYL